MSIWTRLWKWLKKPEVAYRYPPGCTHDFHCMVINEVIKAGRDV